MIFFEGGYKAYFFSDKYQNFFESAAFTICRPHQEGNISPLNSGKLNFLQLSEKYFTEIE